MGGGGEGGEEIRERDSNSLSVHKSESNEGGSSSRRRRRREEERISETEGRRIEKLSGEIIHLVECLFCLMLNYLYT